MSYCEQQESSLCEKELTVSRKCCVLFLGDRVAGRLVHVTALHPEPRTCVAHSHRGGDRSHSVKPVVLSGQNHGTIYSFVKQNDHAVALVMAEVGYERT
jgi:hypothetical protein